MAHHDDGGPVALRPRKGNRVHKLRRKRKVEDNPMAGGSLRRIYPALVRKARASAAPPGDGGERRPR